MCHARLLQRVRPGRIAITVVQTQKVLAQIVEGVRLGSIVSSAGISRQDDVCRVHLACTRLAPDPRRARHVVKDAKLASIRADAAPAQGPLSARTAPLLREVIAKQDPPTVVQRQGLHAHLGTSALVELRTSKFAR